MINDIDSSALLRRVTPVLESPVLSIISSTKRHCTIVHNLHFVSVNPVHLTLLWFWRECTHQSYLSPRHCRLPTTATMADSSKGVQRATAGLAEVRLDENGQPLSKNALKKLLKKEAAEKKKAEKAAARVRVSSRRAVRVAARRRWRRLVTGRCRGLDLGLRSRVASGRTRSLPPVGCCIRPLWPRPRPPVDLAKHWNTPRTDNNNNNTRADCVLWEYQIKKIFPTTLSACSFFRA